MMAPVEQREVLRCDHCSLVQFRTANALCRRCHKCLEVEEPEPAPAPLALVPTPIAVEGGLQVATAVRDLRHVRNLSQRQLATRMGVPRTYISKIETYGGEKIQYTGERIDGEYATVSTRIITKNGTEVPVDYRMTKRGDRWLVYDVSIEGVSLVSSYRTQFNKIIQTSSYNELVSKLKNKQDELLAEDKGAKKKL